jgi:hypothetical protein
VNNTQKITIKYEYEGGQTEASYTSATGINGNDDLFWAWLIHTMEAAGISFVAEALKEGE